MTPSSLALLLCLLVPMVAQAGWADMPDRIGRLNTVLARLTRGVNDGRLEGSLPFDFRDITVRQAQLEALDAEMLRPDDRGQKLMDRLSDYLDDARFAPRWAAVAASWTALDARFRDLADGLALADPGFARAAGYRDAAELRHAIDGQDGLLADLARLTEPTAPADVAAARATDEGVHILEIRIARLAFAIEEYMAEDTVH